jgi:glycosyltransferase involved in cell wall biosynthesis
VGAAAARNRGVAATSADYLFMLDSDDVIFQNSLRYLAAFAQKEHASWVFGDFLQADEQLKYAVGCDFYGWFFPAPQDLLYSLLTNGHFFQQNCFYTRQLFLAAGGFDESLKTGEDFDLFVRFTLKNVEAKFFPGPLYIYRRRRDSLAAAYRRDITPHKEDIKNLYYKYQDQIVRVLSPDKLVQVKRFISTIEEEISARRD